MTTLLYNTENVKAKRYTSSGLADLHEILAIEEPLEISISFQNNSERIVKNISVTMRTPGNDKELALGFLFTEGLIKNITQVKTIDIPENNKILISLMDNTLFEIKKTERHFYTTSSCGVCGKTSIEAIRTIKNKTIENKNVFFKSSDILRFPSLLLNKQDNFEKTGGLHASAIFNMQGEIIYIQEDVGRHNALDKVIGTAFQNKMLPLNAHLLLLSGRASFELIQKAAMAGIPVVAAVGAPSSLAVELAEEMDITLIGFLRNERFNIYSRSNRIRTD